MFNYQKEYAGLIGRVDRAISILENYAPGDPVIRQTLSLLFEALQESEEHYLSM